MSATGSGFQAAGGLIGAYGAYQQGQQEQALQDQNASVARRKAKDVLAQGRYSAQQIRSQVAGILGAQGVGFAGMNVMGDSGTPLDVSADTARVGALDALTTINNAARQAYGLKVEASNAAFQGKEAAYAGKLAAIGGLFNAAGAAVGAA